MGIHDIPNIVKPPPYDVTAFGSIENYTKWPLILQTCEVKTGRMNMPMKDVMPGSREYFSSHKNGYTFKGTWVRATFQINKEMYIHFMYSVPFNQNFFSNRLAVAISPDGSDLNAKKMYSDNSRYMDRKNYRQTIETTKMKNMGFCAIAQMGSSHKPEISFKVYPESFDGLNARVQEEFGKNNFDREGYNEYISQNFALWQS